MSREAIGAGRPVPELAWAAQNYAARLGGSRPANFKGIYIVASLTEAIAQAYDRMPTHDEHALAAFRAMREETKQQFDFLTRSPRLGGLGIIVEAHKDDPYGGPLEMMLDVQNGRLEVYASGSPGNEHPFFSDEENDMFRVVHDAFGHAATGRGFDRHGEEAAFRSHASMYSPLTRLAMATATRGQNSWFIQNLDGHSCINTYLRNRYAVCVNNECEAGKQLGQLPSNITLLILYILGILFTTIQTFAIPVLYALGPGIRILWQ
jgi:hypothetical protein